MQFALNCISFGKEKEMKARKIRNGKRRRIGGAYIPSAAEQRHYEVVRAARARRIATVALHASKERVLSVLDLAQRLGISIHGSYDTVDGRLVLKSRRIETAARQAELEINSH